MGIETSLERVANALERIASTLEENTNINDWYKGYLTKKDGSKVEAALAEAHVDAAPEAAAPATEATAPATDVSAAPEMSYDELKAFLIARGFEIPKGTKMTTLKKLYEKHKNTAPIEASAPATEAPAVEPASAPAPEAPAADPFDLPGVPAEPAPAPERKPMTKEEAGDRIRKVYQATEEHRKAFVEALTAVGVPAGGSFQDVPEDKFGLLVETFEKLIGAANA